MQERPDQATVLLGMARFLATEVRPALTDKALSFRVLIASAVCTSLALEQPAMHDREIAEMQALGRLLEGLVPSSELSERTRRETLRAMNEEIARMLREDSLSAEQFAELAAFMKSTLGQRLAAINPRFDLRDAIEDSP